MSSLILLGSGSPRRGELFSYLFPEFETTSSERELELPTSLTPHDFAEQNAKFKAAGILNTLDDGDGFLFTFDTIVVLGDRIMGKPKSHDEALSMLGSLSGQTHEVLTGYSVVSLRGESVFSGVEATQVRFFPIQNQVLKDYVEGGEPMGKAGAYAIQGFARLFVERIEGCFYNVVGLPVARLSQKLLQNGILGA
jgi:septum formation protein